MGGGAKHTPIPQAELLNYYEDHGWPSSDHTTNGLAAEQAAAPYDGDLDPPDTFHFQGFGRNARNIDLNLLDDAQKLQYGVIEGGLNNYFEIDKTAADSGEVMLLLDGEPMVAGDLTRRLAFVIGGVCYNPKALV